jgi:hypothetical protein
MPLSDAAIIESAREITGNQISRQAGSTHAPDAAITAALQPLIRELNRHYGTTTGVKEAWFTATAAQQDYTIATVVGADVFRITDVRRSGEQVPASAIAAHDVDPRTGLPMTNRAAVDWGYETAVPAVILGQEQARRSALYEWEVVSGTTLRLIPVPDAEEEIYVRYVATGFGIDTLPVDCETCLVYGACMAILDAHLNRINSAKWEAKQDALTGATTQQARVLAVKEQRDRYEELYEREFRKLTGA